MQLFFFSPLLAKPAVRSLPRESSTSTTPPRSTAMFFCSARYRQPASLPQTSSSKCTSGSWHGSKYIHDSSCIFLFAPAVRISLCRTMNNPAGGRINDASRGSPSPTLGCDLHRPEEKRPQRRRCEHAKQRGPAWYCSIQHSALVPLRPSHGA